MTEDSENRVSKSAESGRTSGHSTSALQDLIARLEKATGPNFALECEIATFVGPPAEPPLPYTASLTAARRLIPAGLFWHIAEGKLSPDEPLGACQIVDPGDENHILAEAEAATAELATCIAALKARAKATGAAS